MLARQEGAPAQMALCESVGRKAAGGGDENAARVDAMNEQPVKWEILFLTVRGTCHGLNWSKITKEKNDGDHYGMYRTS